MFISQHIKWHPLYSCHGNRFAFRSRLCGTGVSAFCLNQTSFTLNELIRRPTATWALHVFWAGLFVLLDFRGNWETSFITKRDWSQKCCHGYVIPYLRVITHSKFESYRCHFERYSCFCDPSSSGTTDDVINLLICITQKLKYLWNKKKILQNCKGHYSLFWKLFQIL